MTKAKIKDVLIKTTSDLLEMVEESCYNELSSNCIYLLSEIPLNEMGSLQEKFTQIRQRLGKNKPMTLDEVVGKLKAIYEKLYDVNLYVFEADINFTIVLVRYFPRYHLDSDFQKKVKNINPMIHCKILLPIRYNKEDGKFDVNWIWKEASKKE